MMEFYTALSAVIILIGNFCILVLFTECRCCKKTTEIVLAALGAYCLLVYLGSAALFGIDFVREYCMILTAVPSVVSLYFLSKDSFSKWLFSVLSEFNIFLLLWPSRAA